MPLSGIRLVRSSFYPGGEAKGFHTSARCFGLGASLQLFGSCAFNSGKKREARNVLQEERNKQKAVNTGSLYLEFWILPETKRSCAWQEF